MRGIIVISSTSSVVFHTAPFGRDVVDHIVALVESDIQIRVTSGGGTQASGAAGSSAAAAAATKSRRTHPAFQATLRTASVYRHGGTDLVQTAQWLEADHKKVSEGLVCAYPAEHPWLASSLRQDANQDTCALILWRKASDRVVIFVLDHEEPLALARNAMANFVILTCEAFHKPGSEELPTLKEMVSRPELVQACCSCVAPQHVLVMAPLGACRIMLQKLLSSKGPAKGKA